jgi:hypothetical protein
MVRHTGLPSTAGSGCTSAVAKPTDKRPSFVSEDEGVSLHGGSDAGAVEAAGARRFQVGDQVIANRPTDLVIREQYLVVNLC